MLKDTNLLQKDDVSHNNLHKKIERVISLVESIDLTNPISAKLLLVASCIESTALYEELLLYRSIVGEYYMPNLAGIPSFVELGQRLSNAADKLFCSDLLGCYRRYERLSVEGFSEKIDKDSALKIQTVNLCSKKAHEVFNKLKSFWEDRKSHYNKDFDFSKVERFNVMGITDLISFLSYLCFSCNSRCIELNEAILKPTFSSLKKGLELFSEDYLNIEFPQIIKQFDIDRKLALDEFDDNTSERIAEEIKYLQLKKNEIQNNCNKDFFNVWIESTFSKNNKVNYEAVINKLRPERDMYVENLMNEKLLKSNLKEVYLYEYITSEIKRIRVIQKQNDKILFVKQELSDVHLFNYRDHREEKSLNQEPEKNDLKSFKQYSLFVRDKVNEVIEKIYFDSPANLALIETAFFDHNLIRKRNNHMDFLKDLIKMDVIKISDEDISKTANGMSVKQKNFPKKGYNSWPDSLQNDKKTCMDIAEILGPTIKYKGLS